jgi:cytosine deaminase
MMTDRPAKFLRREDYGVAVGNASDLVVWDATTADKAVSINAEARFGFKSGRRTFARPAVELHCPS